MGMPGVNNTYQNMAQLIAVFSDAYSKMSRVRNYYGGMRTEARNSFEESRRYWTEKADRAREQAKLECHERKAEVENMVNELINLERQITREDMSYAMRRENEYSSSVYQHGNYDSSVDCYEKLRECCEEATALARECSNNVRSTAIQELGMLFSNKRKQRYERLYFLINEIRYLKRHVISDMDVMLENQIGRWNENQQAEIDKAAGETADLIDTIDTKEKEELSKISQMLNMQMRGQLHEQEVELLQKFESFLGDANLLPQECFEYILIGKLKKNVSEILKYREAVNYLSQRYPNCFSQTEMILPAIYDMSLNFDFCFDAHGNNDEVKSAIHSVIFSMLKNQPASRQTFILSDPEGRGRGFDTYLKFARQYPDVFGEKVLTTKDQLRSALYELSSFVDEIGQTKFAGYKDIFDYNKDVPDKQEHLRCLCLLNFPKYFDENMLDDLLNIVRNGKTCGVQVLIGFDEQQLDVRRADQQMNTISRILEESIRLEFTNGSWQYSNGISVVLNSPPTAEDLRRFGSVFAQRYKEVKDTSLPLTKILSEDLFSKETADRLAIPIGKNEDGQIQSLVFGEGISHHALVIGSLGSGKSTLLHTIIMSSLMNFSPDEINLYLMDFKSGTEFKVYGEYNIPHIKLLALDAMQEFGQSILDELWAEMNRRSRLFNELIQQGMDVKDITDYRRMTGKKMPRILVIADEFQMLVSEEHNRKIANYCGSKLADFISLSRVYGIHFVLATQTMSRLSSGFAIRKSTINEMYVRIGLKCIESECMLLFGDKNSRTAFGKMSTEMGSAVYTGNYSQSAPVGFKVAFCDQELQKILLSEVEDHYSLMEAAKKTKVFVGASVPKLMDSEEFRQPVSGDNKNISVFLGEPIRIDHAVRINLNRTKRNNLLIAGSTQEMTDRLVGLYMTNVLRVPMSDRRQKRVYLFDGLSILGESRSETIRAVCSVYQSAIRSAEDNYDAVKMVDELYSAFLERKEKRQTFALNAGSMITVVINNMQWIESIGLMLANRSVNEFIITEQEKKEEKSSNGVSSLLSSIDSFMSELQETTVRDTSNVPYGKKLAELIEHGYTCGIHFVMSVPDYISVKDLIYTIIPKFGNRILFGMSDTDAGHLLNDARTESLRDNIVIYSDGINPSYQFKPYSDITEYIRNI